MKLSRRARGISRIVPINLVGARLSSFIFLAVAVGLFLVSAARPDNLQALRTGTADFFAPALYVINKPAQMAADYVRTATGIANLQEENARLLAENARLRDWYQTALVLKSENASLQKLLNIKLSPEHSFVTARVIGDAGNTYARTLMVMAGKLDNVDKGQAVLSGEGLIGRVVEAGQRTSRILLLNDINARVPILVEGSAYRAVMAGSNGDFPTLQYLPPDAELKVGQRIITSGHGGLFPYGLPVGEVVRLPNKDWGVKLFADSNRMTFVRIVDRNDNPELIQGDLNGKP